MPRAGFCVIACALVAVCLGRGETHRDAARLPSPPAVAGLNSWLTANDRDALIDLANGRVLPAPSAGSGLVATFPVCSPWVDARGRREIIASWHRRSSARLLGGPPSWGLARFSYPDNRLLERLECDRLPSGPPAWLPGTASRVVFASGDGELYRFDLGPKRESSGQGSQKCPMSPPLSWLVRGVESETRHPMIRDVSCPGSWPGGPWLLASVYRFKNPGDPRDSGKSRVWWLRLTDDASAIADAGPLALDRPDDATEGPEEYSPVVVPGQGGRFTLAYLSREGDGRSCALNVARLKMNPATGAPGFLVSESRVILRDVAMNTPAFSPDGQWIYAVTHHHGKPPRVVRLAL